jgi:penicillin-binding protein 1B
VELTPKELEKDDPGLQAPEKPGGFFDRRERRIAAAWVMALATIAAFAFGIYYVRLSRSIDRRLASGPFPDTVNIYAAPRVVKIGDSLDPREVVRRLLQSGYSISSGNPVGWYSLHGDAVEIFPGPDSYSDSEPAVLHFAQRKLTRITSLQDNSERNEYQLAPQLITNLSRDHEERRLTRFAEIPPVLVQAVISVEDKRFFYHSGFDSLRILKAAYVDLKKGRKQQGASTLSMQLARGLWLDGDKNWRRKFQEILITLHLEEKLTKRQIFEDYANQVYLGRQGPFSIHGFGEAARTYLGKDLAEINTAQAALLAGMVQRPSYYNPYRYPDRARQRRDLVLSLMRRNGYLSQEQYRQAAGERLQVSVEKSQALETSYFLDVVNDQLQTDLNDPEKSSAYVYTTLDSELQSAAEEAVRVGMENVDQQLRKRRTQEAIPAGQPQVALVALDPHTGEVRALVGGRSYGASQLNHALAMRQPGSVFKPFVYAAAMDTAITGGPRIFTPATVIDDSPTSFSFGNQTYAPSNFGHEFFGEVTLRTALAHSLNVATVKLAQEVSYDKVVAMARRAGLSTPKPTPAVALGAYEATPLEIARAYTMFANQGQRVTPSTIALVRSRDGAVLYQHESDPQTVLDPRVAFLMVNLMEEVIRSGTAAGVRSRGFYLPAAGKTGTSRDGWFAGFTSELLCVVWVGFDDNRNLNLEGAKSALPIWTEFMKRASQIREYRDARAFPEPAGLVSVDICADSGQRAGPFCPRTWSDLFIEGTQPAEECTLHSSQSSDSTADRVIAWPPGKSGHD